MLTLDTTELHRLANEARFAFEQALMQNPQSAVAERGLQQTIALMVAHEIRRRNVEAAEAWMADLPAESPELNAARDPSAE